MRKVCSRLTDIDRLECYPRVTSAGLDPRVRATAVCHRLGHRFMAQA